MGFSFHEYGYNMVISYNMVIWGSHSMNMVIIWGSHSMNMVISYNMVIIWGSHSMNMVIIWL